MHSTTVAAQCAGCDAMTARRFGVLMKGRPPEPLWTDADVRHLSAIVLLRNDSADKFYDAAELVRITRGARHSFVNYIVVRGRTGIGVRTAERAINIVRDGGDYGRVLVLPAPMRMAVAV
jgi:hypothetical protein